MNNDDNEFPTTKHRGALNMYAPTFSNSFANVVQEPQKTSYGSEPAQARPDVDSIFGRERRSFEPPPQTPQRPRKLPPLFQFPRHDDNSVSVLSPYVKLLNGKGPKTVSTPMPQFRAPVFQRPSSPLCMRCLPS